MRHTHDGGATGAEESGGGVTSSLSEKGAHEDWVLQIKYVVARDTGVYECKVSQSVSQSIQQCLGLERKKGRIFSFFIAPPRRLPSRRIPCANLAELFFISFWRIGRCRERTRTQLKKWKVRRVMPARPPGWPFPPARYFTRGRARGLAIAALAS